MWTGSYSREAVQAWGGRATQAFGTEVFHNGLQMPAPMKLAARVGVCPAVWSLFDHILCCPPILSFGNGNVYFISLYTGSIEHRF